jgi:dihydrofolate synthase / folylpolyglutamate synthase
MPIETYEQALAFWHSRINYELRGMPADLRDLRLDRMAELLARLGDPQRTLRIVHIAGSKGKGSTAAMLSAVLQAAGFRTGLFTSPHLTHVEERVQVDGRPIPKDRLTALMREIEPAVLALEAQGMPPTFFEIVTALGFLQFARERVDWAILEVGLGGRFDATNVCTPRLTVITSISFDHTQQLGNTLASIAREKAGIIKPHVPLVHGVEAAEARAVIAEVAADLAAPVRAVGDVFDYGYKPGWVDTRTTWLPKVLVHSKGRDWPALEVGLHGRHQALNAAVVVACVEALREQGHAIPDAAVVEGLRQVQWPARMEVISRQPLVILDCAHNVASIQALLDTVADSFAPSTGTRALVFAASRDKDVPGMLRLLVPHFEQVFFTRYQSSTRAAEPEKLVHLWQELGGRGATAIDNPWTAWLEAQDTASCGMFVITGSVFLAGELRPLLLLKRT